MQETGDVAPRFVGKGHARHRVREAVEPGGDGTRLRIARFDRVHLGAERLDGEDRFLPAHGDKLPSGRGDAFAVRFHLHPAVKANRLSDGHGAMLMLPNREVWTFGAYEDSIELEEGVYLAGREGPRRTIQLVIYGRARKMPSVRWTFVRGDITALAQPRAEELDLEF